MSVLRLQKRFQNLDQSELFGLIDDFRKIDLDDNGWVDKKDIIENVSKQGKGSYDKVREALKQVSIDASGHVELEDYVELNSVLKRESSEAQSGTSTSNTHDSSEANTGNFGSIRQRFGAASGSSNVAMPGAPAPEKFVHEGSGANAKVLINQSGNIHTINDEERAEFTRHINTVLAGDALVGDRLPVPLDSFQIFDECTDGLILSSLINDSVPDTIDTRVLNFSKNGKPLNNFKMLENANIVLNSAKAIGCVVVNVHSEDIVDGKEHLILGLIWQIIRKGLLSKIDIKIHPELYRLLEEDETLEEF